MRKALFSCALACICISNAAFSAVEVWTGVDRILDMPAIRLKISDEITPQDVVLVRQALQNVKKGEREIAVKVWLDSMGGDVYSALEIGRILRAAKAITVVYDGKCASACVFILAAGVHRSAEPSSVGIHRPTFTRLDKNLTYAEVRVQMEKIDRAVAVFLEEMDISSSLLEAMKAIPPERIQWLNQNELKNLRLTGFDPTSKEIHDAVMADHYKISKQEYIRRVAAVDQICISKDLGAYLECAGRVLQTGR